MTGWSEGGALLPFPDTGHPRRVSSCVPLRAPYHPDVSADPEMCYLDAVQARERFSERSLSPVELVANLVARIEDVEPKVKAFTHTFFDRAMDEARAAEKRYAGRGASPRPLEGLPLVIKDFHDVKGEVTTYGSRLYEHHRPRKSLAYVDRLLRAGAILLARTTTPEFALLGVTHSGLWGITRNPWNLDLSPGGSSGGAGAALAAGMTTLADGSDIGGSIRIPASCCGVFGLKPSHGRVPSGGPGCLDPYLAYGPMTHTVADAALMMNVMAGWHRRDDPASVPGRLRLPLHPDGIKGWRIGLSMDLGYFEVDPEVVRNTEFAVAALREAGAIVEEVIIPWTHRVFEAGAAHYCAFPGYPDPDTMSPEDRALLSAPAREYQAYMRSMPRLRRAESNAVRLSMYRDLANVLGRHRALVTPTTGVPSVPADLPIEGATLEINGKAVDPVWGWCLSYPFNMLGHLPSASAPSGSSSSGVPTGLQIVGSPYDEAGVLRIAAALERVRPRLDVPARRPDVD